MAGDPGFYGRFYHSLAEILSARLRETNEVGIAEYAWGGRLLDSPEAPAEGGEATTDWGGGSPLRDTLVD